MVNTEIIREIARPTDSKIVLLVIDGLGGLPLQETGLTEMETARTPNLDRTTRLAVSSAGGRWRRWASTLSFNRKT
jgi:2,3-bisphosphoglycerate-independent phosphoglycerate mutase